MRARSVRTGVLCPSLFEFRSLDRAGIARGRRELVCSGMGKVRAAIGCHRLARAGARHILLVGFCGALTPSLSVGDTVEPSLFIEQDYVAEPLEKFPNILRKDAPRRLLRDSLDAVMLTQDRFLTENPYRGGPYAAKYPRLVCDMESFAVARFCREAGIAYSVVKLVSDVADGNAHHDFLAACRALAPVLNERVEQALRRIENRPTR